MPFLVWKACHLLMAWASLGGLCRGDWHSYRCGRWLSVPSLERLVLTLWGPSSGEHTAASVERSRGSASHLRGNRWSNRAHSRILAYLLPRVMSVFNQQPSNNTPTQKRRDGTLGGGSETRREAKSHRDYNQAQRGRIARSHTKSIWVWLSPGNNALSSDKRASGKQNQSSGQARPSAPVARLVSWLISYFI